MPRNLIAVTAGVILSFVVSLAGSRLAWLWIIGNVDQSANKDAIVRLMILQTFGVVPAVAIIVGAFVAFIVQRALWWLGGISILPLLLYRSVAGAAANEVGLSLGYAVLAFAAAFLASRLKHQPQS